jgi:predicted Zn-dependent protease with MMP-like domain
VFEVTREEFESFVDDALDAIPESFASKIVNVAFLVEDDAADGNLFGLYEGVPLTRRVNVSGAMPDRITIYQNAICRACFTEAQVREQVRETVIHEIGHYFGIDDPRLRELGH